MLQTCSNNGMSDDKIENFSSLKEEFERKNEWDYDCLVSFNNRLFMCLCPNECRDELCDMMNEISKWIAMATPIDFSINSLTTYETVVFEIPSSFAIFAR